jgi:hypothetical protein
VEFLAELANRGYIRTSRWHEEWVVCGLLDRGRREGGMRLPFTWQQEQVELASTLLLHAEKGAQLASLANVVVCIWLWWGDAFVPFRQVPRALRTWLDGEREPAEKHVRATARELTKKIAHPRGSGKRQLVRALVDFTYRKDAKPEDLRDVFDDVVDPDRTGTPRGPDGAQLTTEMYLAILEARIEVRDRLGLRSEAEYLSARELYRASRVGYALQQPWYARDPDLGDLYEESDWNEITNSACADLLTCLAAVHRRAQGRVFSSSAPSNCP